MTQPDDVIKALGICAAYFDLKSAEAEREDENLMKYEPTQKMLDAWYLAWRLRWCQAELCKAQKETK